MCVDLEPLHAGFIYNSVTTILFCVEPHLVVIEKNILLAEVFEDFTFWLALVGTTFLTFDELNAYQVGHIGVEITLHFKIGLI